MTKEGRIFYGDLTRGFLFSAIAFILFAAALGFVYSVMFSVVREAGIREDHTGECYSRTIDGVCRLRYESN